GAPEYRAGVLDRGAQLPAVGAQLLRRLGEVLTAGEADGAVERAVGAADVRADVLVGGIAVRVGGRRRDEHADRRSRGDEGSQSQTCLLARSPKTFPVPAPGAFNLRPQPSGRFLDRC